ncbi:HAD-IC family P-type ATPase [Gandjariella thermophila]|uniref:HAD-IC family P-type ATPase n=1 Tax=Gandjariella thermophila TaxID=1931992 RepID=UPI001CEF5A2F|nr:HAD-IC family P-type ATPase [Gandjariella thermophila]
MSGADGRVAVDAAVGLTAAEVRRRVDEGLSNAVARRGSRSVAGIVRANVFTRFNAIIAVLFAVMVVVGPVQDTLFALTVAANTAIGIVQELRAKRTLDRLSILGESRPRVRRDGTVTEIPPAELVVDDLIELGPGDEIVVDGVVAASTQLEVDESLLTGEAEPVHKRPGDHLLSGSFAVAGSGSYQATRVGRHAYAARLAEEAGRFSLVRSELRTGINQILKIIAYLMVPVGALVVYSQMRANAGLPDAVRGMVAALVPMVPEGLVLLTSIAFAVGVIRLAGRQCLVQELPAIEGLARVSVVCADKTGTLTDTGMRLAEVRQVDSAAPVAEALGALAAADPQPNPSMRAIADANRDGAGWRATATAPFSSARRWSGASFADHGHWVLGAPDALLRAGHPTLGEAEHLGRNGLRVLLLGHTRTPVDAADAPGEVTPVALVVLEQRIRPDAADTLRYFAQQHVAVKVISGDGPASVGAVAAALHLPDAEHPVDARRLPEGWDALAEQVAEASVFGRVAPAQKRAMVAALRFRGDTVAMTGDGVNDVLALKNADIGVAMGTGSPATRAVAQIVLLDNRFATLPHVVAEGRRVIGNIERVANLFLIKTVYSVALAVLIGAVGLPFPFLPRHLTLIGAVTIGIPAFFLALAPNPERARPGFVPRVLRMSVPAGIVAAGCTFATYLLVIAEGTADPTQRRTAAVIALFLVTMWALGIVARPYVWWKIVLLAAMGGMFVLVLLVPYGRWFFALDPGGPSTVVTAVAVAGVGTVAMELGWWLDGWLHHERRRLTA